MKRTGNQVLGSTTLNIPVAAGENMKECTIAAINASGYAVTGKKAEGLVVGQRIERDANGKLFFRFSNNRPRSLEANGRLTAIIRHILGEY